MKAAIVELRDPAGAALAIATGIAARLVQPSLIIALLAAVAVLAVKSISAALWHRHDAGPTTPHPLYGGLTRRELEIARLVGAYSNKEIGARLHRSERTVDTHVQHILAKLGFHSRSQIAVWAEKGRPQETGAPPAETEKSAPK